MNPACAHCGGPIDVLCHNGATLRCGCGKTMADNAAHRVKVREELRSEQSARTMLEHYLSVMRRHCVTKLQTPDGYSIELAPLPAKLPSTTTVTPMPDAPDESCTCGHALHAHTDVGCTYGCDLDTCGLSSEAKAEATE